MMRAVVHEIKTFAGYGYWVCDGADPEDNRLQLKKKYMKCTKLAPNIFFRYPERASAFCGLPAVRDRL
jgi:hypothetical protein